MTLKLHLYIVSLFFLFVLLFINKVPYCWGSNCELICWSSYSKWACLGGNKYTIGSLIMMVLGLWCYINIKYLRAKDGLYDYNNRIEDILFEQTLN